MAIDNKMEVLELMSEKLKDLGVKPITADEVVMVGEDENKALYGAMKGDIALICFYDKVFKEHSVYYQMW